MNKLLHLLLSRQVWNDNQQQFSRLQQRYQARFVPVCLDDATAHAMSDHIDVAFYSRDLWEGSTVKVPNSKSLAFFEHVSKASRLQWLQLPSAGTDLPIYHAVRQRQIVITTAAGVNAKPIAQTVVAAMLAQSRGFMAWQEAQRQNCWSPLLGDDMPIPLEGQRVVIVGAGHIGTEVARMLQLLGFVTIGVRRSVQALPEFHEMHVHGDLPALLPDCHWLVLACPLTHETRNMLDRDRLALFPAHARLVNISRGELIDESALQDALENGKIASAFLDVFQEEPLPPESRWWTTPNVWISPHNAAAEKGYADKVAAMFFQNLEQWLQGQPLHNMVTGRSVP